MADTWAPPNETENPECPECLWEPSLGNQRCKSGKWHKVVSAVADVPIEELLPMDDPLEYEPPPVEAIAGGLLPRREIALIHGETGSYKTWVAIAAAIWRARELHAAGHEGPGVYVLVAESPDEWRRRYRYLCARESPEVLGIIKFKPVPLAFFGDEALMARMGERFSAVGIDLLVVDTGAKSLADDVSENDNTAINKGLRALEAWGQAGITTAIVTHPSRDHTGGPRGARSWLQGAGIVWEVSTPAPASGIANMKYGKQRFGDAFADYKMVFPLSEDGQSLAMPERLEYMTEADRKGDDRARHDNAWRYVGQGLQAGMKYTYEQMRLMFADAAEKEFDDARQMQFMYRQAIQKLKPPHKIGEAFATYFAQYGAQTDTTGRENKCWVTSQPNM